MSTFNTTLFKLLSANAQVIIDGYEIETISGCGEVDAHGAPVIRCECDEDNTWYFADQEVTVRDGACVANTATGYAVSRGLGRDCACVANTASGTLDDGEESYRVELEFSVTRPIEAGDL